MGERRLVGPLLFADDSGHRLGSFGLVYLSPGTEENLAWGLSLCEIEEAKRGRIETGKCSGKIDSVVR